MGDSRLAIAQPPGSREELEALLASLVESRDCGLDDVPGQLPCPVRSRPMSARARLSTFKVFDAALEAAVRWCAAGAEDKHDPKDDVGLPRETENTADIDYVYSLCESGHPA